MAHWLIAKTTKGTVLGSEALSSPSDGSENSPAHALALTPEFRRLSNGHWPGGAWIMVDRHRFIIYRPEAGVLGFITLGTAPG